MTVKVILLVDTDTETIQKIMSILESADYLVFTASNKEASISMARKINPSLIFVNAQISGESSLEICKSIHDTEKLRHIPIVIITPYGETIDPNYTSLYGIVDFLKKPFGKEELISKARDVLHRKAESIQQVKKEIIDQPAEQKPSVKDSETYDIQSEQVETVEVTPIEDEINTYFAEELVKEDEIQEAVSIEEVSPQYQEESVQAENIPETTEDHVKNEKVSEFPVEPVIGETVSELYDQIEEEILPETNAGQFHEEIKPELQSDSAREEEKSEIRYELIKEDTPDESIQPEPDKIPEKQKEKVDETEGEKTEEPLSISPYDSEKIKTAVSRRKRKHNKTLFLPFAVLILIIGAVGLFVYKNVSHDKKLQTPYPLVTSNSIQESTAEVEPLQEEQKTQKVQDIKPLPPLETEAKPVSTPKPSFVAKQALKPLYSVQIGAFKNEANAVFLSKNYKELGYDTHIYQSRAKDNSVLYRVLIGNFENKKAAVKMAGTIRTKENINTILFHR